MSYKSSCKKSWKKFVSSVAKFFSENITIGKWGIQFKIKF